MFKNLEEVIKQMPDETTCRACLASQRCADGIIVCPNFGHKGAYVIEGGKAKNVNQAHVIKSLVLLQDTVFESSNIPVRCTLILGNVTGRLTYKQLVYGKSSQANKEAQKS